MGGPEPREAREEERLSRGVLTCIASSPDTADPACIPETKMRHERKGMERKGNQTKQAWEHKLA
jgi:hypothetical protein